LKHTLLTIIFFGCIALANAQPQPLQFQFTQYTPSSGLTSYEVNSVTQDKNGYLWIATAAGLQRFDGIRFKTYLHDKNDPWSLPSNIIWQLMIDNDNNLWVTTADGQIGVFNTDKLKFRTATIKAKNPKALPYAFKQLIKDEQGNVFLLLRGSELMLYNKTLNEFSDAGKFFNANLDCGISGFAPQPGTKKYWFARQTGGFMVYNGATGNLSTPEKNIERERAVDTFNTKFAYYHFNFDIYGRLWYNDWQGFTPYVACYDVTNNKPVTKEIYFNDALRTYYEIGGTFQQRDGTVWALGAKVFARYREKEKDFQVVYNGYLNDRSIVYEHIRCLFEDREKNVWVATSNNGLYRFNPKQEFFTNISHINRTSQRIGSGSLLSFIQTKWGTIFAGTWGDGIYHYDKDLNNIPINIKGIDEKGGFTAWCMYPSGDGKTLWMTSQPGLYKINQDTRTAEYFNPPVLQNRTIRQVVEDKNGNLWLGMQGMAVYKWERNKRTGNLADEPEYFPGIPKTSINKISVDSKGLIWVATPANGTYAINPDDNSVQMHFGTQGEKEMKIADDAFSSVIEYNDSLMVLTTVNRIYIYNRLQKQVFYVGQAEHISGYIAAVEKDKNGQLWISTTTGLFRINIRKAVFIRFDRHDGIENDNFTLAASAILPDGRLLFGSSEQFIVFNPDKVVINTSSPEVVITNFEVMNKPLLVDSLKQLGKAEFRYNQNSFVIEFSPLVYSGAYLLKYKLEKLDKEWKIADKDFHAVYTYVPPGNYTFMVAAVDENGQLMEDMTTTLKIKVKAPFWKAWWFYSLEILLIAILLFWWDRERMSRKEAIQKMRNDIADNLHEEVNNSLNNINILSEMARMKADSDPQKSKEYIEQIHAKSHNMIIAVDDMLWSIDPSNDNMERTVERMKEYIDSLKNRHGVEIDLLVDKKVEKLELNMKLRHEAFVMFKDGIKNLVDAGTKFCQIHIGFENSRMIFTVQFDNDDCNMQQLHNLLQRQDMEKRLNAIGATLKVEVHKSSSLIVLQIPVE
jgi:ligand-binding sensor domain-containing protein/signal transduction histidine kinase